MKRLAIIGAGAAGLAVARRARWAGLETDVLEQSSLLGGVWNFSRRPPEDAERLEHVPRASLYDSLRTNLPRVLMAFRDFPFSDPEPGRSELRAFPSHRAVDAYLQRFAEDFELSGQISRCTRVTRVRSLGRGAGWQVDSVAPGPAERPEATQRSAHYDAVSVCTGHYAKAHVPALENSKRLSGRVLHSQQYRRPAQLTGKTAVLLGAGPSGLDLALELAAAGFFVKLCAFQHSVPLDDVPRIETLPAVERFSSSGQPILTDGRALESPDNLIYCTGYRYDFPFFEPPLVAEGESVEPLHRDVFFEREPTLSFVGLPFKVVPFPQFDVQAEVVVQAALGRLKLPDFEERRSLRLRHEGRMLAQGLSRSRLLEHGNRQFRYHDELAELCGLSPLPVWLELLYEAVGAARRRDPAGYRDFVWPGDDEEARAWANQLGR